MTFPARRCIFGIFAPDLRPEARSALHAAMAAAFPDRLWHGADVAAPGAMLGVRTTHDGRAPSGPATAPMPGGGHAAGALRLFRRADGAPPDALRRPDAPAEGGDLRALAAAGMQDGALRGMEGAFAIAVAQPPRAEGGPRLLLLRDMFGLAPLWLADGPGGALLFCSTPQPLLAAAGGGMQADPVSLAMLMAFRHPGHGHAARAAIRELPRGCRLTADAQGIRVERILAPAPDPDLLGRPAPEIFEAVETRIRDAVLSRAAVAEAEGLRIGIELSGGLDSALIASILAEDRGALRAWASTPARWDAAEDLGAGKERAARMALLARHPGIALTETDASAADFFAGAAHYADRMDAPCPDPTAFTQLHLNRVMAEAGIGATFSGMGGDFCLSSHQRPTLPELSRAQGLRAAWAETTARRAAGGRLRNILIGDLVKPSAAFTAWMRARPGEADPILSPAIAHDPRLAARMRAQGFSWRDRRGWSMAAEEIAELSRMPCWPLQDPAPFPDASGSASGPLQLSPLLDGAALSAALAAPPELRLWRGMRRGLVRRMLASRAPEIAARPDKAAFQPDHARLQAAALPRIRADSAAFEADPRWREVVNGPLWRATLDRAERADPLDALRISGRVILPWFLGWWLRRSG